MIANVLGGCVINNSGKILNMVWKNHANLIWFLRYHIIVNIVALESNIVLQILQLFFNFNKLNVKRCLNTLLKIQLFY